MAWKYSDSVYLNNKQLETFDRVGLKAGFGVSRAEKDKGEGRVYVNTGFPGTGVYLDKVLGKKTNRPDLGQSCEIVREGSFGKMISRILLLLSGASVYFWLTDLEIGIIISISLLISFVVVFTKNNSSLKDKSKSFTYMNIKFAQDAIDRTNDPIKIDILNNFINCISLSDECAQKEGLYKNYVNELSVFETKGLLEKLRISKYHLDDVYKRLDELQLDIDKELTEVGKGKFSELCISFEELLKCDAIWNINNPFINSNNKLLTEESRDKSKVMFDVGVFNFIKSSYDIPIMRDVNGILYYIYPRYIICSKHPFSFDVFMSKDIRFKCYKMSFDGEKVVKTSDEEVLLSGGVMAGREQTTSDNLTENKAECVEYGKIECEELGIDFVVSDYSVARQFVVAYNSFSSDSRNVQYTETVLKGEGTKSISEEYFNEINNAVSKLYEFYSTLRMDSLFISFMKSFLQIFIPLDNDNIRYINYCLFRDVILCYKNLSIPIDYDTKYGLAFYLLYKRVYDDLEVEYKDLDKVLRGKRERHEDFLREIENFTDKINCDFGFMVAYFLSKCDRDLRKQYLILLYRFSSILAKSDGTINSKEQDWLDQLLKIDDKENKEKTEQEGILDVDEDFLDSRLSSNSFNSIIKLDKLIGLKSVKEEINTLVNFSRIQMMRSEQGLRNTKSSYHCVFTGNPGTGKTTVARIVAEIYRDLGVLKKGHLVETDRSGLIGEYVGHTAVKTNKIIDSALDGVLFIDEAYSLIPDYDVDYGKEAVATLLKRMEDDRERLVVILAGYTNEMQSFIDSNPGLKSRFSRYIEFQDYSAEELYQIFILNLKQFEYNLSEDAVEPLKKYFSDVVANKDSNFGNARFVRNLFEKCVERKANRLSKELRLTNKQLTEIKLSDII